MANPIKSSDLYQNTGELEVLLGQLVAVEDQYKQLIKTTQADAVKLNVELKKLNVTQKDHKDSIQATASEAEKLRKAQKKYEESLSDVQTEIVKVREATKQNNREKRLEVKLANSAAGSYDALSAQYSLNKIRLNAMTKAQRETTKEGQDLVKTTAEIYEEMKRLQEETGKHTLNVGNYKDATKDLLSELNIMPGALNAASNGTKAFSNALKVITRNPIVGLITGLVAVLGALFKGFSRSEKGAQLFAKAAGFVNGLLATLTQVSVQVVENFTAIWGDGITTGFQRVGDSIKQNLIDRLQGVVVWGKSVGQVFSSLVKGDLEGAKNAFIDVNRALLQIATGNTIEEQEEIAESFRKTREEVESNIQAFMDLETAKRSVAKQNRELAKSIEGLRTEYELQLQIQEDDTLGFQVRQEAAEKAREANIRFSKQEIALARNSLNIINEELALRRRAGEDVTALEEQQLAAYQAFAQAERDYTLTLADGEEKRRRLRQDTAERDLDILIDGFDNQKAINERRLQDESLTFDRRREILQQTVDEGQRSFDAQIGTLQGFTDQAIDANGLLAESDAITLNARIRSLGLSEILEGRLLEVIRDRRTAILDLSDAEAELAAKEQAAAERRRAELLRRADEEQKLEMEAFDQQQALAQAEFELIDRTETEKTRFRLEAERNRLQKILELNAAFQGDLTDTELATYRALIQGLNNELDALGADGGESRSLFDLLGIDLGDNGRQLLTSSLDFAKEQLTEFANFRAQIAQQNVDQANTAVDAAQNELDAQIRLAEQGFSSRVDTAQKELELARQNQQKALAEQRRAQRQQQLIQAAEQATNLVTASTKIWSQFGFPGALIPLTILWGSFAASKIRAFQLTKKENRLGGFEKLGTAGMGRNKEDINLGMTNDGRVRTASKDESLAIFTAEATRKYSALPQIVEAINRGTFERMFARTSSAENPALVVSPNVNTSTMEGHLSTMAQNSKRQIYTDGKGRRIEIRGNVKNIYLN